MAIDKAKIFPGEKGKYIDICLIEHRDPYGNDYIVVQDTSREERQKRIRGAILGNAKIVGVTTTGRSREITPADDLTSPPRKPSIADDSGI